MEKVGLGSAFRVLGVLFAAVILLGSLLLAEPPEGFHAAMAPAASGGQGGGADLNRGQMVRTGAFYRMVAVFTCGLVAGVIVISQASPILQQTLGYAPPGPPSSSACSPPATWPAASCGAASPTGWAWLTPPGRCSCCASCPWPPWP